MHSSKSNIRFTIRSLALLTALMITVSGCQILSFFDFLSDDPAGKKSEKEPKAVETVYVQSITGQQLEAVKQIFFQTVEEQKQFRFVELLPENLSGLAVLRLDILDYAIWENEEPIKDQAALGSDREIEEEGQDATPDTIIRRNANVRLKVSLFDAESGEPLIRSIFSQPFQQIYIEEELKHTRPEQQQELHRLLKLLIFRILASVYQDQEADGMMVLEIGRGYDLISDKLYNLGDRRLKKGIRHAEIGEYDKAKWIWKIVLYSPAEDEPKEIYLINRASAYYNLGQLYQREENWLEAAKMFSYANRLQQKLKYAHAWGESMQAWLEREKQPPAQPMELADDTTATKMVKEISSTEVMEELELILDLEVNNRLLLKAKELWPLDPDIKKLPPE